MSQKNAASGRKTSQNKYSKLILDSTVQCMCRMSTVGLYRWRYMDLTQRNKRKPLRDITGYVRKTCFVDDMVAQPRLAKGRPERYSK